MLTATGDRTAWWTAGRSTASSASSARTDAVRTVHMVGEPVLDADGGTASMWAVLRDVSELRRSQRAVRETRDSLQRQRQHRADRAPAGGRAAGGRAAAVARLPAAPAAAGPATLDLAAHYLPVRAPAH